MRKRHSIHFLEKAVKSVVIVSLNDTFYLQPKSSESKKEVSQDDQDVELDGKAYVARSHREQDEGSTDIQQLRAEVGGLIRVLLLSFH